MDNRAKNDLHTFFTGLDKWLGPEDNRVSPPKGKAWDPDAESKMKGLTEAAAKAEAEFKTAEENQKVTRGAYDAAVAKATPQINARDDREGAGLLVTSTLAACNLSKNISAEKKGQESGETSH